MLIKEPYTLPHNRPGCRHYSDAGYFIHKIGTDEEYVEAIDVEPCRYEYEETDKLIKQPEENF